MGAEGGGGGGSDHLKLFHVRPSPPQFFSISPKEHGALLQGRYCLNSHKSDLFN